MLTAVITGDIKNSETRASAKWLPVLESFLKTKGQTPKDWEVYRGDEFQLKSDTPSDSLKVAIILKLKLKAKNIDTRLSIGIGKIDYTDKTVTKSNGEAFQYSGRTLDTLKKIGQTLAITTESKDLNINLNLKLKLALTFIDSYSTQACKTVLLMLENPEWTQKEASETLGVNQSSISQRLSRAHFDLVKELLTYFSTQISTLST